MHHKKQNYRKLVLSSLLGVAILGPLAFGGTYQDVETEFTVSFDGDVPPEVLSLVAKKLGTTKAIFSRAKIYWTKKVGPNVVIVRTATRVLLVQTDLGCVDDIEGELLSAWNDILVFKRSRQIVTMNRKDLTVLNTFDIPVYGDGTETWTDVPTSHYLILKMRWDPSLGGLAAQVACIAALGLANPFTAMLPPYPEIQHTNTGTFHFLISGDGSISNSGAVDSVLGFFR